MNKSECLEKRSAGFQPAVAWPSPRMSRRLQAADAAKMAALLSPRKKVSTTFQ
jgi:hypothetical protein